MNKKCQNLAIRWKWIMARTGILASLMQEMENWIYDFCDIGFGQQPTQEMLRVLLPISMCGSKKKKKKKNKKKGILR